MNSDIDAEVNRLAQRLLDALQGFSDPEIMTEALLMVLAAILREHAEDPEEAIGQLGAALVELVRLDG